MNYTKTRCTDMDFRTQVRTICKYISENECKSLREISNNTNIPIVKVRRMLRPACLEFRKNKYRNMSYFNEFVMVAHEFGYRVQPVEEKPYVCIFWE